MIPILVYTSVLPADVAARIPESTAVGHLTKPASPDEILAAIRRLLGRRLAVAPPGPGIAIYPRHEHASDGSDDGKWLR